MTAKEFVKAHLPSASIEKQETNGGEKYYLIRKQRFAPMYMASGKTAGEAWKNAKEFVKARLEK